jgi:hypothetical protein
MEDHDQEMLDDITGEGVSNCCGAKVYKQGDAVLCTDCKEFCEEVEENQ